MPCYGLDKEPWTEVLSLGSVYGFTKWFQYQIFYTWQLFGVTKCRKGEDQGATEVAPVKFPNSGSADRSHNHLTNKCTGTGIGCATNSLARDASGLPNLLRVD